MGLEYLEGECIAGRFELVEMVGQGGYGAVFDATQLSVGRRCAVKLLLPGHNHDESVEKRFRVEARTTSRLAHPNTVVLYDFGVDEETGLLFLVTEFLDGLTLHQHLKKRARMGVGRTVRILEQVAGSLGDAHDRGVVHRDVKPKNIMLVERAGRPDFVKVIDFGIVKALSDEYGEGTRLTRTGMMIGTPKYMAPEQLRDGSLDGRADQYALAVVAYRMLTGRNPFRAGTPMETAMRQVNDQPLPLRTYCPELEVSADFEDVLLRALEKSPRARFDTVADFVNALRASVPQRVVAEDGHDHNVAPSSPSTAEADGDVVDPTVVLGADEVGTGDLELSESSSGEIGIEDRGGDTADEGTAETAQVLPDLDNGEEKTAETARAVPTPPTPEDDGESEERDRGGVDPTEAGYGAAVDEEGDADVAARSSSAAEQRCRERSESTLDIGSEKTDQWSRRDVWLVALAVVSVLLFAMSLVFLFAGGHLSEEPVSASEPVAESAEEVGPVFDEENDREENDDTGGEVVAEAVEKTVDKLADARQLGAEGAEREARSSENHSESVDDEPAPSGPAEVTVTLIPWGTLYVDGEPISDETRQSVTLDSGRYELSLRQEGVIRATRVIDVTPGESKMVTLEAQFDQ